jgi:hypothetical protein
MTPAATPEALVEALTKINDIRNSIIGFQTMDWSEHIYPLVAALNAAGFDGMSYPEARKNFGTLLERTNAAEDALATAEAARLRAEVEALKARDKEVRVEAAGLAAVLCYVSTYDNPKALRDLCHRTGSFLEKHVVGSEPLARAATAGEG